MRIFQKHHRFLWLIFSSLALLAVFQALWLQKVWREQHEALQQETNYIFQQTVMSLQDSLVRRSLANRAASPDSMIGMPLPGPAALRRWQYKQDKQAVISLKKTEEEPRPDSIRLDKIKFDQVQIFIATDDSMAMDGAPSGIRHVISRIPAPDGLGQRKFVFNIGQDTIAADSLQAAYRTALTKADIPLDFNLLKTEGLPQPPNEGIRTEPAFSGLLVHHFYAAEFPAYRGYLLGKMLPHLLFSFLLFGVTATAFALIYKSLRHQQRLTALKNDFIGNITHELKTPITTVGVALEALSDFEVLKKPEQALEYLNISKLELERLTLLVDKVLRLSMFGEKEPRLQLETLDFATLVRSVLNAMKLQAESTGAEIHFETQGEGPFRTNGDRLHLTSVVFNLVDNALKYRGKDAPVIKVSLGSLQDGGISLAVQDNGIGIAPEFQAKVFEKFFRVPAGNIHNVKGHGLGLSYVASVLRQHGGNIRVESEEGKGSRFVVELPGA